ncbi:ParB N-terminal domain-containing protein [Acuticoccus sp. I52.16.1]|uniref:ParB/RepB/Spo0J family partition protein n=1 Tax=Acuticoccus sp. I52.16.1 TaxID=2928472 RepID=UPI001FD00E4B|nr:ParB N-terminal domain-containing protein [Acuticoccus sp. I52.16.1]UOM37091.1 ParB N-terminal domain-containing protein [Acuticoccus sp. I52.16.1]
MAKRKRLTPARLAPPTADERAPETKSADPVVPASATDSNATPRRRPPIAGVAGEAAAIAALNEMGQGLEAARSEGRLLLNIPLDDIDVGYLVRDRIVLDDEEMATLTESLRRRGQQTAIEVADLGEARAGGRWGLISGWRRVMALRNLGASDVLAAIRHPQSARLAYQAMVEENEIRAALSYYERARIAVRSAETGVYPDTRTALSDLFASASRPRRSKIGSFMLLVEALDGVLKFPAAITERQGLALVKLLDGNGDAIDRVRDALATAAPRTADEETDVLARLLSPTRPAAAARSKPRQEYLRPGLLCRETAEEMVLRGPELSQELREKVRQMLRQEG